MRTRIVAIGTLGLALIGAVVTAAPAHAFIEYELVQPATPAQVWTKSFERAGKDAPCVAPANLDIPWQSDWSESEQAWTPTWEQWPNGGTGGWTCFRQITWAKGSPAVYRPMI